MVQTSVLGNDQRFEIIDRATFADPLVPPAGIELVFVGGKPVLRDGVILDRRAGKSVRG